MAVATGIKSHKASRRRRHSVHPLQRLLDYGHEYQRQIWLAAGASILNKVFDLAPPALIGIAVDVVVKQQDSIIAQLGIKNISGQFAVLSFLTVVTWILESFFEYLTSYCGGIWGRIFSIIYVWMLINTCKSWNWLILKNVVRVV
jgi:ATP-binding cassette subfamily B protein